MSKLAKYKLAIVASKVHVKRIDVVDDKRLGMFLTRRGIPIDAGDIFDTRDQALAEGLRRLEFRRDRAIDTLRAAQANVDRFLSGDYKVG